MNGPNSYEAVLQELFDGAVMSKFVTARECEAYRRAVDDCMRALRSCGPNVPEGWKLVPIKPTDAMIEAQFKCWHDENGGKEAYVAQMYTAMVEACPPFATGTPQGKKHG